MKRVAAILITLGVHSGSVLAQTAYPVGPHTWVGYGKTANQVDCYATVFNPENAGLMPSNIYWDYRNSNCYGLEMVGKPTSPGSVGKYIGACYCPYNRDKNGKVCGLNSAYVYRNGQAPQCFVNDIFRNKSY